VPEPMFGLRWASEHQNLASNFRGPIYGLADIRSFCDGWVGHIAASLAALSGCDATGRGERAECREGILTVGSGKGARPRIERSRRRPANTTGMPEVPKVVELLRVSRRDLRTLLECAIESGLAAGERKSSVVRAGLVAKGALRTYVAL
jgi:hypothetical protein